ncbi:MAG: efflux RND transporter permease subunit [Sodalinema sp.]|uniref:efflux RND transporter permease subunit n=1 Tax=Sodalinema sp. TaxID=3080550 RepID=UPI00120E72E1|nr:MAG: efflux RND transporter permease subunit [Phormidium sp. SL48-SHIP]
MFYQFFIKRPVFASVCSLLLMLVGIVGYGSLPVQELPSIDPPVVSVTTVYPGANPSVVETEVTEILEAELNSVDGVRTLTSQSRQAVSSITVQFDLDQDVDIGAQEVQRTIAQVVGELPDNAESPVIRRESGDAAPIIWFGLYSEEEGISTLELSDYADRFIVDALETIDGVSSVIIGGERRYAMRLWIDPQRLEARNLTILDVQNVLRQENIELPSGRIEGNQNEFSVRTLGRLREPEEYEALVLRTTSNGTQIRFQDIGYAEIGAEDDRSFVRFNGRPAVGLGVVKLSTANTLNVAADARAKMTDLKPNFPPGMNYEVAVDNSEFVQLAIDEVWGSLYVAVFLVIVVIFFFLRDWRATIVPAVTIPVSLISAFGIMFILDFSINTLTLFALTLATGLVVDDTIVVLENIVRYIEQEEMKPYQAAIKGLEEVIFAVIATTVVLVAVFLPVGFATGVTGQLFAEFALTLAGSVIVSSFVALTLAPSLSARVLKPHSMLHGWIFDKVEDLLTAAANFYASSLRLALSVKPLIVVGFILSIGLLGILFSQIPKGFLPDEDRGQILTIVNAPQGVSIDYTDDVMRQVEAVYEEMPEVRYYFSIGAFGRGAPGQVNQGIAFVRLQPWSQREEPQQSQQALIGQLFGRFSQISDALIFPVNPPALPGGGLGQPVQLVLQGPSLEQLADISGELAQRANQLPELRNVDTTLKLTQPEVTVEIDRQQAANLGINAQDISNTLQILLGGQEITSFNRENRRYEVVVQAEEEFRLSPESIRELSLRTSEGELVPLSNLVRLATTTTPPQIEHYQRFRSATIEGSPAPGYSLGEAIAALQELADEIAPDGVTTALAGESLEFAEAGEATAFIFGLAMAFIFLVLSAQFESYLDPIVVLLTVPLSLVGALGALMLFGLELNIYSQIGLIMLIGLATKNAILIVEFANQKRAEGFSIYRAVIEAGRIRFRPILMTAFSTIFGLMPLAFATGAGAMSRVSIGMSVVGGMFVSTLLSLYVIPVFYVLINGVQKKMVRNLHLEPEH